MIINSKSTTTYSYDKETEYVFSCRGRPFTSMVSNSVPTPMSTLIDYELVRDLKIKMTDLKCEKYTFAGFQMRILGQICTAVQCVKDGFVAGTFQLTATVVLDLAKNLDTFSVAGKKLASLLSPTTTSTASPSPKTQARTSAPSTPVRASPSAQARTSASPSPKRATTSAQKGKTSPTIPSSSPKMTPAPSAMDPKPPTIEPMSPPSTISHVSVRPLSSPPGFPTPSFVCHSDRSRPPACLSVRAVNLQRSPLSTNLEYLDETFQGADKMTHTNEEQTLRKHFKDAEFQDLEDGGFVMKTGAGLRYWSGHGEYKCQPSCVSLYGNGSNGVPNNCGFHQQWLFPEGFRPCGPTCKGAFCTCL